MLRCRWISRVLLVAGVLALSNPGAAQEGKDDGKSDGKMGANRDFPLVTRVLAARSEYQLALEELRKHYIANNDLLRARWAEEELIQFHRINKQAYRLELELPPPTLKGDKNLPQANALFRQAKGYKDKGWSGSDYVDNQRRAEILFQRILTKHSESDKIDDVAYNLGDIYEGRAFQQYARAGAYFERCYQWNPKTATDARLRAARLYERQLNDRGKALDIYKLIMRHETDERRVEEAKRKVQELSNKR